MKNSMFARATNSAAMQPAVGETCAVYSTRDRFGVGRRHGGARKDQRGSALVATMVVFVAVAGLVLASTQLSSVEIKASRRSMDDVRATALAESGVEATKASIANAAKKMSIQNPLAGVRALFSGGDTQQTFTTQPMMANGANVGEYTTSMELVRDNPTEMAIRITSTGYIPAAPANLRPGEQLQSRDTIEVTVSVGLEPSSVFDSAYFVNNWGWLYANSAYVRGNARSNGQMDMGGYRATVTGSPTYDDVNWSGGTASMGDRNSDGGVFSSWDIVGASRVQGLGGDTDYQFDFEDPVEMPNLSDLTEYETRAIDDGATISVGGTTVANGVVGDDSGESDHLFLHGTLADPIVLDGPVVVRGDVMLSGYVTGHGAIYAGGNVYVPDSIEYVNAPGSDRPASNSDADIAAWVTANQNADFLGLFARENVVIGDFTDSNWTRYVGHWLASSMNASAEDSGADQIPNTSRGRDGISGTADDDRLEGDGIFTTEIYSMADAALGLIPNGFNVGDRIPGTGEDIDGDGQYDATLTVSDFNFQAPLDPAHWEGNMPSGGYSNYRDIASMYANHLDASFYTNHALSWVVFGSQPATINGAMVCRNESIVYGTPSLNFNHDARLLGGASGIGGGLLPYVLEPMETIQWRRLDADPFQAAP